MSFHSKCYVSFSVYDLVEQSHQSFGFLYSYSLPFFSVHSVLSVELMCSYHGAIELSERETVPVHDLFLFVHTHNALTLFHCTNLIQSLSLSFLSPTFCNGSLTLKPPAIGPAIYSLPSNLNIFYYCHTFPHIYLH